jgi:hypothetical protein
MILMESYPVGQGCHFAVGWLRWPMRKTRNWLYVFLPVLYLTIVFGLVVFQFSKKSDSFSQSLGDMTVSGKTSENGDPVDLSLHGRGLEFQFSASKTLVLVAADGSSTKYRPTKWTWKDGNLEVEFEGGIGLTFQKTGTNGGILLLQPRLPEELAGVRFLRLPFAGENGGRIDRDATHPFVTIIRGNQSFLASLDGEFDQIDSDNNFVLTVRKGKLRPVRLEGLAEGAKPLYQWLVQGPQGALLDDARVALVNYIDKAYKAWGDTRFKASQGGWLTSDGSVRFSSRLVASWAHQALERGAYPAMISRVQAFLANHPNTWNYDALPYLGNLIEVTQAQRRELETLAWASSPDWAGHPRLWLDAKAYGPEGGAAHLQKLLLSGDLPTKTADLVGVLANLATMKGVDPAVEARVTQVLNLLVVHVVRQEDDLFVATAEGHHDLRSGLILGRLLLDQTSILQSDQWQSIGSQLLLSALHYQDALTKIPQLVLLVPGQPDKPEGGFYLEEVYAGLLAQPAPEVELGTGAPAGSFVRSANPVVAKTISESVWKLRFQFPVGAAESVVVVGLPPFDSILLHGIRWRTDPQFQSYSDGWYYSASTRTLYVKIKHREELEELVINMVPQS